MISFLLFAAIQLSGVTGSDLRARAFFDCYNVKVGDPMVLTIDFLGEADFKDLHPPALSRQVDRRDWKLDDASAKTDTFRDARRLTYRVRPMREGVLWFPAIEFEYQGSDGTLHKVRANDLPVHAKAGREVVVAEMGEDTNEMPRPPELVKEAPDGLGDDMLFAWRRVCTTPTADGFAAFDFAAAKLNEATCAIREGNWARAMDVYRRLEWKVGQTPQIEQGMVAALALRYDNPRVELPVWRQVLRPLLRYGWSGRVGIVLGGFAVVCLVFWLLGRGIRALACIAFVLLVPSLPAQDIFQQMEEQMQRMRQQMQQSFGGFNFQIGQKEVHEDIAVEARLSLDRKNLQVGEPFAFIIALEVPRSVSVGQIRMTPSEIFGLTVTGQAENLPDGKSANPTNVIKRLSVPVRYDVPFKGRMSFAVEGMMSVRGTRAGGRFSFSTSRSFRVETPPIGMEIRPLSKDGQPADFSGIVSEGLRLHELCDILRVETNDVVQITYRMMPKGYVPEGFLPAGAAFEWVRQNDNAGHAAEIEYRRFFVADGSPRTPQLEISYYDPRTKTYRTARAGGTELKYDIINEK